MDRLARALEGGGRGEELETLLRLEELLGEGELARLGGGIARFYEAPHRHPVRVKVAGGRWSRLLLWAFGRLARQSLVPAGGADAPSFALCQRVYRDARGRAHWDRYAWVSGAYERLFTARVAATGGRLVESFDIYGIPVSLPFSPSVEGEGLTLTLARRLGAPASWFSRVVYRTERWASGLRTRGDFRVPLLGFRIETEFLIGEER